MCVLQPSQDYKIKVASISFVYQYSKNISLCRMYVTKISSFWDKLQMPQDFGINDKNREKYRWLLQSCAGNATYT